MAPFSHEYCSSVFYHSNQPPLDERLTVLLPLDAALLRDCHLYFEVSHCSSTFLGGNNETSCFAQVLPVPGPRYCSTALLDFLVCASALDLTSIHVGLEL